MTLRKKVMRFGLAGALLSACLVTGLFWRTQAQEQGEGTGVQKFFLPLVQQGATTHFHPPLDSWPPQPAQITDVKWLVEDASATVRAAQAQVSQAEAAVLSDADVLARLGERYVRSTTSVQQPKAAVAATANAPAATTAKVTFFSYTHNATIEVTIQGSTVVAINEMPASVYQPEPTRAEKSKAIALARAFFRAAGHQRILQLGGYVIQAYAPEGTTGFYPSRVLYVTFHEEITARPEFGAWVDMTAESVIKSFYEQSTEGQ